MKTIQYTVRGVPPELDQALRREAHTSGKTLNALLVETLTQAKLPGETAHDDLDWFIGSEPASDEGMDAALAWLDEMPTEPT